MTHVNHVNENFKNGVLFYLHQGIIKVANERTSSTLGNRGLYIGASDLAKAIGCFRLAVLDKVASSHSHNLLELLRFERGHWQEDGIAAALVANAPNVIRQLQIEFRTPGNNLCRFHLDMVMVTQASTTVLESKSMGNEPGSKPYESHHAQIRMQIVALHHFWDTPAFRIAGTKDELRTFPEFAQSLGYSGTIQRNIKGALVCITMT